MKQKYFLKDFVYIDHLTCTFNKTMCGAGSYCKLKFKTRLKKTGSFLCNIQTPLDNITSRVTLYYRFRNGYKKFLMDVTTDVCAYFKQTIPSVLFETVKKAIHKYSNILDAPCPQTGSIWAKDCPVDGSIFPKMFLPAGSYYISIENFSNGTKYVDAKVYFVIPEGKTIEDDRMG